MEQLATLFFDSKYILGKHFQPRQGQGWFWVWRSIWTQKLLGFNKKVPWPVNPFIHINGAKNLHFHPDDLNNFQTIGSYFQCFQASIYIGKGTYIASNVGIITSNHNPAKLEEYSEGKDVIIGENCWIGMNSVILPGVVLGDNTIVGAGSVVTRSFLEGNYVIAGNPAKIIKEL